MSFDINGIMDEADKKMSGAVRSMEDCFAGLRTGRASTKLLDHIKVESYGQYMPINQLSSISILDSQMLSVQVWDRSMAKSIENAIRESGLGLNPISDGQLLRIPIPPLSEERRKELIKKASEYTEHAKIALRNVRRHILDTVKKLEKDKRISEDEMHNYSDLIQKKTDGYIKQCDDLLKTKSQEILG